MSLKDSPGLREIQRGELTLLEIRNEACTALVSYQGAQVLSFVPTSGEDLLWLSEKAVYQTGKAIRGGIPLCFPWFGPHPEDASKPAHGFARNREWQLVDVQAGADSHRLRFRLEDDEQTRGLWPYRFVAELEITLGHTLELALSVNNRDDQPFTLSNAFHSYFPIQDIRKARVDGLDGVTYIDQLLAGRPRLIQQDGVSFSGETDRIYLDAGGDYRMVDLSRPRQIGVHASNCRSAIVWNPWQEKTAALTDMLASAWTSMACLECGNVEENRLLLRSGEDVTCLLRLTEG